VFALAFDADGTRIVAGCEDVFVRVWRVPSGELERAEAFPTPGMLAMSPKGRWMAVGAAWLGRVAFLDLVDPALPLKSAPFHDSHMNSAIRFSPDGSSLLAAAKDGTVRVWSMDPVRSHSAFDARCGILLDAAFNPDGTRIIAAGADGVARIWPVDSLRTAEQVCPVSDEVWEAMQPTLEQALFGR
jgi:WD40 repeat protein